MELVRAHMDVLRSACLLVSLQMLIYTCSAWALGDPGPDIKLTATLPQ